MGRAGTQVAVEQDGRKQLSNTAAVFCLALLAAAYITNAMDRHIFPTLLPMISKEMGYGVKAGGFVSTVFNFGIAFTGIPAGILIDRWSRKAVLVSGMVVYSIFTLMAVFAIGLWDMTAYRALTGVGEAMQIAALYVAAGSYFYIKTELLSSDALTSDTASEALSGPPLAPGSPSRLEVGSRHLSCSASWAWSWPPWSGFSFLKLSASAKACSS